MKKRNLFVFILTAFICSLCTFFIFDSFQIANAESSQIEIVAKSYELGMDNNYNFSSATEVETMSYGKKQLGVLSISGEITDISIYREKTAYGLADNSQVSFSYSYDGAFQTDVKENYNLRADEGTVIDEYTLSGSIGKGVLLVQKSSDGYTWVNAANPVTNFYETNKSGKIDFYTTDGNDVAQGTYYRVILAYKIGKKTGTSGILFWKEDVFEDKRYVELYEFYLVVNSGTISIHNLTVDESILPELDGFSQEEIKRGETLTNESMTTKGFSIDKLGTSYLIKVSKDGDAGKIVDDGAEFTENGKYTIKVITKLDKQLTHTVYVFNGGKDKGYSTYFGESIIDGNRVYRDGDYPTYAKNTSIKINNISEFIPILSGTITNLTTNESISLNGSREEQNYVLSAGLYSAEFVTSTSDSGSLYSYKVKFNVIDENSSPYINFNKLSNLDRLSDYYSKHYEVVYPTTAGGYIYVCFSIDSYDEALKYAYEIEKRFIEKADDGKYYKSIENPNKKIKYINDIELTDALNYYAEKNVEYDYFNPKDLFTYRTFDNDLLNQLGSLESISISESIKVFPSKEEKQKIYDRQLFINDFEFINAFDYDVVSVKAYCHKNSQTYNIEFNKNVSNQLTVSSKYTITEINIYGDEVSYDVYYINENQTKSNWDISYNGEKSKLEISSKDLVENKIEITADSVTLTSIVNEFDRCAIVTVKAPSVYSYELKCMTIEMKNFNLYKKGSYEFTFIDRLGNSYQIIFNITGKSRYIDVINNETVYSYTNLYNTIYIQQKDESEEIKYDVAGLNEAINRVVNPDEYIKSSYDNYLKYLNEAKLVYENPEATQEEINTATKKLNIAYESLVKIPNKAELLEEIKKFESVNKSIYTMASYENYLEAYNDAVVVYETNVEITTVDIENAIFALQMAKLNLVKRGKKDTLYITMQYAEEINCSLYTPKSIEELNTVYEQAISIFNNIDAIQIEIDNIVVLLEEKIKGLIFVADFSGLYAVIEQVKTIDAKLYKTSTINVLKEKFNQAVDVYNDWNNTQRTIDTMTIELTNAKNGLILIGDNSSLEALIDEISEIVYMIYTKDTILALRDKYEEVIEVLYDELSQAEIDNYVSDLNGLKDTLKIREDKQELYYILLEIGISDELRTESFAKIYNDAKEVLKNLDATEEEVLKAIENVNSANNSMNTTSASSPGYSINDASEDVLNESNNLVITDTSNEGKDFIFEIVILLTIIAAVVIVRAKFR